MTASTGEKSQYGSEPKVRLTDRPLDFARTLEPFPPLRSIGWRGENSPNNSRIEPLNRPSARFC
jgi:hypothetical protein